MRLELARLYEENKNTDKQEKRILELEILLGIGNAAKKKKELDIKNKMTRYWLIKRGWPERRDKDIAEEVGLSLYRINKEKEKKGRLDRGEGKKRIKRYKKYLTIKKNDKYMKDSAICRELGISHSTLCADRKYYEKVHKKSN